MIQHQSQSALAVSFGKHRERFWFFCYPFLPCTFERTSQEDRLLGLSTRPSQVVRRQRNRADACQRCTGAFVIACRRCWAARSGIASVTKSTVTLVLSRNRAIAPLAAAIAAASSNAVI